MNQEASNPTPETNPLTPEQLWETRASRLCWGVRWELKELSGRESSENLTYNFAHAVTNDTLWGVTLLAEELNSNDTLRQQEHVRHFRSLLPFQDYELQTIADRMRPFQKAAIPEDSSEWVRHRTVDDLIVLDRWHHWIDHNFIYGGDPHDPENQAHPMIAALDRIAADLPTFNEARLAMGQDPVTDELADR